MTINFIHQVLNGGLYYERDKRERKKGEWSERISQQWNEMSAAAVSSGWHTDERVTPKCIFYVGTCSSVDENGTSRAHCPAVRDRLLPTKVCLRHWTNILISLSLETYTHAPFRHVRTKFTAIRIPEAPFEIFRPVRVLDLLEFEWAASLD